MKKKIAIIIIICITLASMLIFITYREPKISVLTYHNIGTPEEIAKCDSEKTWTITVDSFKEQLEYLKNNNYKTITMSEFYQWKQGKIELPFKSVLITFDDGKLSNYNYVFPLLKEYNMNAVVFIAGAFIENGQDQWNGTLTDYMSKDIIEKCKQEYPNIEFCSHSYGLHEYGILEKLSKQDLTSDLETFKNNILETEYYAYPFGAYNNEMQLALEEIDYKLAFRFGPNRKDYRKASRKDDKYEIPRLNFSYNVPMWKFKLRLLMPF